MTVYSRFCSSRSTPEGGSRGRKSVCERQKTLHDEEKYRNRRTVALISSATLALILYFGFSLWKKMFVALVQGSHRAVKIWDCNSTQVKVPVRCRVKVFTRFACGLGERARGGVLHSNSTDTFRFINTPLKCMTFLMCSKCFKIVKTFWGLKHECGD